MIYIYETVLFNTSEHNLSKSGYLFELTSVTNIKLFKTSFITATRQDVKKKIDMKFKTLKLLEKHTRRIYEGNKESQLIKQKQLYKKRSDEINSLKMEILEAMIKNENTEEEIEQWTENHKQQLRFTMRKLKRSKTESLRYRERKKSMMLNKKKEEFRRD